MGCLLRPSIWLVLWLAVRPSYSFTTSPVRYTTLRYAARHISPSHFNTFSLPKRRPSSDTALSTTNTDNNQATTNIVDNNNNNNNNKTHRLSLWQKIASSLSHSAAMKTSSPYYKSIRTDRDRRELQIFTFLRIMLPAVLAGFVAFAAFPGLAMWLATRMNDPAVFTVLSQDSSQFVQNFLTVAGLLFSILVGQTWYFLYQQQESVFYALFNEVTEAKSLLEQIALVCSGRSMYGRCLESIQRYVRDDLKRLQDDPAVLLSSRPMDDPLETIMFLTSVGVPSHVYETVRSLRQARAARLGSLQRKLPAAHMGLLWVLAAIELVSFPLLGAGTQILGGYRLLTVEGILFGVMTAGIVMVLKVVSELWRPAGGAYNTDAVLSVMVRGLEDELQARMKNQPVSSRQSRSANQAAPSLPRDRYNEDYYLPEPPLPPPPPPPPPRPQQQENQQQQGANVFEIVRRLYVWVQQRQQRLAKQQRK